MPLNLEFLGDRNHDGSKFAQIAVNLMNPKVTRPGDLLGQGSSAIGEVEQTIRAICKIQEEDGLVFDSASVEGTKIKEDDEYPKREKKLP